jgi:hypothetical protein
MSFNNCTLQTSSEDAVNQEKVQKLPAAKDVSYEVCGRSDDGFSQQVRGKSCRYDSIWRKEDLIQGEFRDQRQSPRLFHLQEATAEKTNTTGTSLEDQWC